MTITLKAYKNNKVYIELTQEGKGYGVSRGKFISNDLVQGDGFDHYYATKKNALSAFYRLVRIAKKEDK